MALTRGQHEDINLIGHLLFSILFVCQQVDHRRPDNPYCQHNEGRDGWRIEMANVAAKPDDQTYGAVQSLQFLSFRFQFHRLNPPKQHHFRGQLEAYFDVYHVHPPEFRFVPHRGHWY